MHHIIASCCPPFARLRHYKEHNELRFGAFDGLPRGPAQARQTVGDHRRHGQSARVESGRPQRHRARRRRAGLRHARQHQAGGDQGDRERTRVEIHQCRRHRRTQGCRCQEVQARERSRLQAVADHHRHRRQAGAVQRVYLDAQSGRRGDHSGALLGELSRHGAARRRNAGGGRDQHGVRLQDDRATAGARHHAENQMGAAELAVEPVGRGLYARRVEGADRRAGETPARARDDRRHV